MTGRLLVLSGPSGVGKTTVGAALLRSCRGLVRSVSATTRRPRPGERHGRDYLFVTERAFAALVRKRGLLEHARVHGRRYGTPRGPVEAALRKGHDVLLVIDVQGAEKVRRLVPGAVLVFLMPPGRAEWMRRLRGRGSEGEAEVRTRLRTARREILARRRFDHVVVNDRLGGTVKAIRAILQALGRPPCRRDPSGIE